MNNNLKEFVAQTRETLKIREKKVSDELKKLHEREQELNRQVTELTRELVDAEIRGNEKEAHEKEKQINKSENELEMVKRKIVAYNSDLTFLEDKTVSKLIQLVKEFNNQKNKDILNLKNEKEELFKKKNKINERLDKIEQEIDSYHTDYRIVDPLKLYIPKKYLPKLFDRLRSNDTYWADNHFLDELMKREAYAEKEEGNNLKRKKEKSYIARYFENVDIKKCLKQEVISAEVFFKLKEYAKENSDIKFKYKFSPVDRFGYTGFIIDFKEEEYTVYVNSEDIHYA